MTNENSTNDQPEETEEAKEAEEAGNDESLIPTSRKLARTVGIYIAFGIVLVIVAYFLLQTIISILKVILLIVGVSALIYVGYRLMRQSPTDT